MEGFDTMTMSYYTSPPSPSSAAAVDYLNSLPALDNQDLHSNFDTETFMGSEDAAFGPPHLPNPSLKPYSSNFDDHFQDTLGQFDTLPQEPTFPEVPSIERDHKLLGFSLPTYHFTLLDSSLRRTSLSLSAQLHGMFFLAESPWASVEDPMAPPTELTCYRRNLFQITGSITLPRKLRYIVTEQGERLPILAQELSISATESVEGNAVKIISVPWKTPASTSTTAVEDKTEKEPPSIPLDTVINQDFDCDYATFPIAWKRLQFRIATANNGRRKELQQHFVIRLKIIATLSNGTKISICEAQSGAIIVRGRSPRNFQARKDFPLSGGGGSSRKLMHPPAGLSRTTTGDSTTQKTSVKSEKSPEMAQTAFKYDQNELRSSPGFVDWMKIPPAQPGPLTALPTPTFTNPMPIPAHAQSSPEISRQYTHSQQSSAPINLSLIDEDPTPKSNQQESFISSGSRTPKIPRTTQPPLSAPPRSSSFPSQFISSPDESADLLYEYFPLGLDDWMPPVDAVYRPHVVHHTNLPSDPKAMAVRNKSKRYFSEDQSS
ncbi:MAG: hypothetical protein M1830_005541 [Pleopsidium flavum]|nr:MAG: hypothetical protein M1830_005541 [Pleopsidium flavum]